MLAGKRITVVGRFGLPGTGAVFARAAMLGRCLRDGGADVHLVTDAVPEHPGEHTLFANGMKVSVVGGQFIRSGGIGRRMQARLGGQSDLIGYATRLTHAMLPDVLVLYAVDAALCYRLSRLARRWGIPCVADICDWFPVATAWGASNFFDLLTNQVTQRFLYRRLAGVTVVSRYLEQYYVGRAPCVHRLPIVLDPSDPRLAIPPRLGSPAGELRIVYAGSPGRHKDRLAELVVAVARANAVGTTVRLTIVGLEPSERARLQRQVQQNAWSDSEYFVTIGRVHAKLVPDILKRNDFSVLVRSVSPSSLAGFPSKAVESCACATPMLISPIGDIARLLVDNDSAIHLHGWRTEELLGALLRAASMTPEAKRRMGERARAAVFPALSQERLGPGLCQFIRSVCSRTDRFSTA